MATYPMHVAGLDRDLPICKVTDDLYIGAFIMFGDAELTVRCAEELLRWSAERGGLTILEGILDGDKYGGLFAQLPGIFSRIHAYYLDIPFEETLRRHATRPQAADFGEDAMRRWYRAENPAGVIPETVFGPDMDVEDMVDRILFDLDE